MSGLGPISGSGGGGGDPSAAIAAALNQGQAGLYVNPPLMAGTAAGVVFGANNLQAFRFRVLNSITIGSSKFVLQTASAGATMAFAIYNAALARLATSGSVAGLLEASGPKTINLTAPIVLAPGVYYAGLCSSGAPTIRGWNMGNPDHFTRFGSTAGLIDMFADVGAGMPPPAGPLGIDNPGDSGFWVALTLH